jgi:hypothetical protein
MTKIFVICWIVLIFSSCSHKVALLNESDESTHITVIQENGQTIKEYRNKGRLYMVEVTPKHGKTYIIYPDQLDRQHSLYDEMTPQGVKWKIKEF